MFPEGPNERANVEPRQWAKPGANAEHGGGASLEAFGISAVSPSVQQRVRDSLQ